jgi:hypothetical protein
MIFDATTNANVDRAPAITASILKRTVGGFGPTFCYLARSSWLPKQNEFPIHSIVMLFGSPTRCQHWCHRTVFNVVGIPLVAQRALPANMTSCTFFSTLVPHCCGNKLNVKLSLIAKRFPTDRSRIDDDSTH